MKKPQFIIAAPTSNSGKTTLTLGLLRALENRGINTQAFKVGPDYIDPKFHKVANGKSSLNLDLYMMTKEELYQQYAHYSKNSQAVCVEGVMGLFDGAKKDEGSTAAVAKELDLPVVLVVNAKSVAYSVAPLLYGFKNFDTEVNIAGVIFNNVNTATHYQFLKEACDDVGVISFGYVPSVPDCEIPSRHLGLSISNMESYDTVIQKIAEALEPSLDIELLLESTTTPIKKSKEEKVIQKGTLSIAVAKDESFNFSYVQNVESLEQLGTVTFFSPLNEAKLPKADLVYFPGGYPELYTEQLAKNTSMLQSVKEYADAGGNILAECGGMMYLGKSLIDLKGKAHSLVGVFNFTSTLKDKKLSLGYRTYKNEGVTLKGHEFHYSKLIEEEKEKHIGQFINARGKEVSTKLYTYKNVLASYMHYYLGDAEKIKSLFNMEGTSITVKRTNSDSLDFKKLVSELDTDLAGYYKEEQSFYGELNDIEKIAYVIVAYDEKGIPVGCGGIKAYSEREMELKRMYVPPSYRGKGIATLVLNELENWSGELKYEKCILETLKQKPYAISFYEKNNYKMIPNFGEYTKAKNSICFEKKLN